jgi:tripartite-type tricarboxylate transporter receptor subunit TctC
MLRALTLSLLLLSSTVVLAQDRTLRFLVGFPAGAGLDTMTRLLADRMKDSLGHPVIVENRPGAGGRIVMQALKNAPADGSTLLLGAIVINVLAPMTLPKVGFDPETDFTPVAQLSRMDSGLAVGADSPYRSVQDYLAAAKADPMKAAFGSPAAGSLAHFFGLVLGDSAGVPLQHVSYKGSAPLIVDLIGGRLPAGISGAADFVQMAKEGRVRLLATSGEQRSPFTPDVPTFREAGFPAATGSSWTGLFAPAGTPPEQIQKIARAVDEATRSPEVRKALASLSMELPNVDSAGFARLLVDERKRWIPVVKASGFNAEK